MTLEEALYYAFKEAKIIIPNNTKGITLDDVILALIIDEKKLPELLGYSASGDGGFKHFRKRLLPNKPATLQSYIRYLLNLVDLQQCSSCKEIKTIENYSHLSSDTFYHRNTICKYCDSLREKNVERRKEVSKLHYLNNKEQYLERNRRRRAIEGLACPKWANQEKIREIYRNCPKGMHVDHIIPLKGKLVSGLHVENNLQYLTAEDNLHKSNKFEI